MPVPPFPGLTSRSSSRTCPWLAVASVEVNCTVTKIHRSNTRALFGQKANFTPVTTAQLIELRQTQNRNFLLLFNMKKFKETLVLKKPKEETINRKAYFTKKT